MCVWCTCAREGTTATMKSVTKWSLAYAHSSLYLVHSPNASYWLFGSFSLFLSNPRLDSSRAADCVCVFSFVVIVNHCVALPIWFCMVSMAQLDCIYIEHYELHRQQFIWCSRACVPTWKWIDGYNKSCSSFFHFDGRARTLVRVWIVLINKFSHELIWYWLPLSLSLLLCLTREHSISLPLSPDRRWWLIIKLFEYTAQKNRPFIWIHVLIVRHKVFFSVPVRVPVLCASVSECACVCIVFVYFQSQVANATHEEFAV